MKTNMFLLILFLLWLAACKEKSSDASGHDTNLEHYEDEVMKVHDDVMPKMSDIQRLSMKLRDIKSKAGITPEGEPVVIVGLDSTLHALRTAEQGMMDWMKNYGDRKAQVPEDLLQTFYERELKRITQVKTDMLNSIDQANAWLEQHPEYK